MLAGQRIPAGLGYAMVLPDFDFETYSEAGYVFDILTGRFKGLTPTKPGLPAVGAAVYSEHPSTEVLSLAYDLKDGKGPRLWIPGMEPPVELFKYLAGGGLIEAWNSGFENLIWKNVCVKKMGWPPLDPTQLRCAMAKGKAFGLPGQLGKTAEVTGADAQKDKRGKQLIRLLSIPQKPTKKQPSIRNQNPTLLSEMYSYNIDDIRSEAAVSHLTPDLSPDELKVWQLDQRINQRGVRIDKKSLDNCVAIVEQAFARYNAELFDLTGIASAAKLDQLKDWLVTQDVHTPSLDKPHVADLLKRLDPATAAYRVVEIRSLIGAASVKKLFAMLRMLPEDQRLKDLFVYCGADRTGRFAGRGCQPQNFPNSGPKVVKCQVSGKIRWAGLGDGTPANWDVEAVETALADIATRNLDWVESQWGDAVAVVSGCLRGLFSAAPGKDLICSDFSAIEAVVLAFMAEEEWRMEVFRTHGKIYEAGASKISGVPLEEILAYPDTHSGTKHPLRKKLGKVSELACFGADTLVLTDSGWKRIVEVSLTDRVHDGVGFVRHSGVVDKGERLTLKLGSVTVTPEHKFFIGGIKWATAEDLKESTQLLSLAVRTASLLFYANTENPPGVSSGISANVLADRSTLTSPAILGSEKAPGVLLAGLKPRVKRQPFTGRFARTLDTVKGCLIGCAQRFQGVPNRVIDNTPGMEGGVSVFSKIGLMIEKSGFHIFAFCRIGMCRKQQLIGLTMTEGTNRVISDSSRIANSKIINAALSGSIIAEKKCLCRNFIATIARNTPVSEQLKENSTAGFPPKRLSNTKVDAEESTERVYDILNCGPRNRFVISSSYGPLIAHNSGYGGGVGSWKVFGADKFMTDDEIQAAVTAWRKASPAITGYGNRGVSMGLPATPNRPGYQDQELGFWYGIQGAAYKAIRNPGECFSFKRVTYGMKGGNLYALLPSGRSLIYHKAKLERGFTPWGKETTRMTYMGWNSGGVGGPTGWMRMDTYGPKLVENLIQGIARDILTYSMLNLEAAGYPIVLHVHDEVISEVPKGFGTIEEFERIMAIMPPWCADWPIKAAGGWRGLRYRKD